MNSASITVSSGTSEISVVKVRLPAVWPSRASAKRRRRVCSVASQGQLISVFRKPAALSSDGTAAGVLVVMLAMMPAMSSRSDKPPIKTSSRTQATAQEALSRNLALGALAALFLLCLAWELWLAPTGRGTLAIKALPLLIPFVGLWRYRLYTFRWLSLMVWLYFAEGAVRATSESGLSVWLASLEVLLSVLIFVACAMHVRLRLAAAKASSA